MTAGELIAELSKHSADLPVVVRVEDPEFGGELVSDVYAVDRVVKPGAIYLDLLASLA